MNTLQTVLLSILVLLELIRFVLLILSLLANNIRKQHDDFLMRVFRKLEYWLDREDEREETK